MVFWRGPAKPAVTFLCAWVVAGIGSAAGPPNQLALEPEALKFIADTIGWYRHLPTAERIGTEPADLLFLETNRSIATEAVRQSFEFGKAVAAMNGQQNPLNHAESAANRDLRDLIEQKMRLDRNTEQARDQLKLLEETRLRARRADWNKLDTEIADIRNRVELLQAMAANYEELLGFARTASTAPDGVTNMGVLVENLARTVPGVWMTDAPSPTPGYSAESSRARGIMGTISRASALGRKERIIDGAIEQTAGLIKSLESVRSLLTGPFRTQLSTFSLDAQSADILERQQSRLTGLLAELKTASFPIAALSKEQMLLNLYGSHLAERRSEIQKETRATWNALIRSVIILGIVIAVLLGSSLITRRLSHRYLGEGGRGQLLLLGTRVLLCLLTLAVILYAFAFDLSSMATFLGLVSAGLAVGLHNVLLAIGGYLVIVRRYHVRIGDRVQISNVSGIVTNLWLMQVELSEIDTTTGQRTGRVAFFSNSYVFVSPATPLFRQFSAPA